jgi:hypothetical protein
MAFGGPAEVLELVQAKRPMLAIDEDGIEVELPQNVDHPWGWEGKVVAVRFASGTHGGFDSVGLLHRVSSCVWRLRFDRLVLSVFGPLDAAEFCTGRSRSSKMRRNAPNGQRLHAPMAMFPRGGLNRRIRTIPRLHQPSLLLLPCSGCAHRRKISAPTRPRGRSTCLGRTLPIAPSQKGGASVVAIIFA